MNEDKLIAYLQRQFPHTESDHFGIGDDAAVIRANSQKRIVITNDVLAENVHFRLTTFSPQALAIKAIESNLSDIAAMGAKPTSMLLGVSIPKHISFDWIKEFTDALCVHAKFRHIQLIGGDTTRSESQLFLSVTMMGEIEPEYIKYRHQAKPGDKMCVTGYLGDAKAGLYLLENHIEDFELLKQKQLTPHARVEEGQWLAQHACVHAMMDLSDGLFVDMQRMTSKSQVGAVLHIEALPVSNTLAEFSDKYQQQAWRYALEGGEDYELLFTVAAKQFEELKIAYSKKFGQSFYCVGEILQDQKLDIYHDQKLISLDQLTPFAHFE